MSVQTLNSQALHERLPADYYDYIVIDESHHAAAHSYGRALEYFQPKVLLGLTATPERMDGQDIYKYFDRRIAAEIRLPEAINRKLLCPFQYFGVSDTVDLNDLRWVRGGYDRAELSNLYTLSQGVAEKRADHILRSMDKYVTDMNDVRALGFCVSIEHARFMADYFNRCGVPALALTGDSRNDVRASAQEKLVRGELRVLFVVDIYNEGVDIPEVNTVLFLRPTESLTIFLQQLGRGLRLAEGKECLTVLDFIGAANRKYNFEEKFAALLDNTNHSVEQELRHGFVSVPKGCYIQLEKKASQIILTNIRQSYGFRAGLVSRIASFEEDSGLPLTLENFLTKARRLNLRFNRPRFFALRKTANADQGVQPAVRHRLPALDRLPAGHPAEAGRRGFLRPGREREADAQYVLCDRVAGGHRGFQCGRSLGETVCAGGQPGHAGRADRAAEIQAEYHRLHRRPGGPALRLPAGRALRIHTRPAAAGAGFHEAQDIARGREVA